jgi:hypothetical protein
MVKMGRLTLDGTKLEANASEQLRFSGGQRVWSSLSEGRSGAA